MYLNDTGAFMTSDHYQVISLFNDNDKLEKHQVYYNYESGNRLEINHIIKDGEEVLGKIQMTAFNEIADILHKDHMVQGDSESDSDSDQEDFEAFQSAVLSVKDDIIAYVDEHYDVELHGDLHWFSYDIIDDIDVDVNVDYNDGDVLITAYPVDTVSFLKENYFVKLKGEA